MSRRFIIATDLSDVLINGLYHIGDRVTELVLPDQIKRYGKKAGAEKAKELGEWVWEQCLITDRDFKELLRGKITEDAYWDGTFEENDRVIQIAKQAFAENLKWVVPETLGVYQRITRYPLSTAHDNPGFAGGIPEIVIVSDHIHERINEVKANHPDVFRIMSDCFWSCDLGMIKEDEGFFPKLLESLEVEPDQVLFIDDSRVNIHAALKNGIHGIIFNNAQQLETALRESYGFEFAEKSN